MTIQIDDANYGGLVGTCLIGIVRVDDAPASFQSVALPIECFQGKAYDRGDYLDEATKACLELLSRLKVTNGEPVKLCQGWVFERAAPAIRKAGYNLWRGRIGEPMQSLIEEASCDYLASLGVKVRRNMSFGAHFFACLAWLKGGNVNGRALPEREALAKTGWATYRVWATLSVARAKAAAQRIKAARRAAKRPWNGYGEDY
jgi:hypothetical protein